MSIGHSIKRIRTEIAHMTQEEFGKLAGVSGMAVSQWENGRAVPRMGAVERISAALRIPKGEIIDDSTNKSLPDLPPNALPVRAVPTAKVPLVGSTHAGTAALSDEFDEFPDVEIPKFLVDRDPGSYGLEVEGDCMDRVCPAGMVAVVQPHVEPKSGDVVVAVIDGAMSLMRRMTVINGALILSPESHNPEHENIYIPPDDERSVHVEHVAYFQSRCMF